MSYKIVWVLVALLPTALAYTDITMKNCPSQFDIAATNLTTDNTAASLGAFVYAGFQSQKQQDRVETIIVKGDTAELSSYVSEMMVPYIIFTVLYFCFYLFTVSCCLFDRSCPPCDSIRRDIDNDPYTTK